MSEVEYEQMPARILKRVVARVAEHEMSQIPGFDYVDVNGSLDETIDINCVGHDFGAVVAKLKTMNINPAETAKYGGEYGLPEYTCVSVDFYEFASAVLSRVLV